MKLDDAIKELKKLKRSEGNIEFTCTGSLLRENVDGRSFAAEKVLAGDVFETTVENFEVHTHPTIGKCVRVWL